jgi:hypothetical protein
MSYKNKTLRRKSSTTRRYNRRSDGVTTTPSTPDRQKLEEDRLKIQWQEYMSNTLPGKE